MSKIVKPTNNAVVHRKISAFHPKSLYFFRICGIIFQTRITRKRGEAKNVYLYCGKREQKQKRGSFQPMAYGATILTAEMWLQRSGMCFATNALRSSLPKSAVLKCWSRSIFQPRLRTPSGVQARLFLSDPMRVFSTAVLQCRL